MELRYRSLDLLGEGGMGEVRLCEDAHLGRQVAMKVMRREHAAKAPLLDRFLGEVRIQGWLEHPAIVPVYDLALDSSGAPYFTMKRIHGTTFERVLAGVRRGEPEFAEWTRQRLLVAFGKACLSVHYAHERGVCHRDLKPGNIMLGSYGEVYVLDWGIAELTGHGEPWRDPSKARTPTSGPASGSAAGSGSGSKGPTVTGTAGYVAPELARGLFDAIDARTDVYALGCILFEILALVPLHDHATQVEILQATASGWDDARPSYRAPRAKIPRELDAICVKATALEPDDRFQSARELCDEIERFLARDRTLEDRRAQAEEHASAAAEAARRALEETDPAAPARREALREASRALALDPSNARALRTLHELLEQKPRALPADVARELLASDVRLVSRVGLGSTFLLLSWFLYLPFGLAAHFRSVPLYLTFSLIILVTAATTFRIWRSPPPDAKVPVHNIVLGALANSVIAAAWGPFIVVPCLAIVGAALLILVDRRRARLVTTVFCACAPVPVIVTLEAIGILPPSLAADHDTLVILPRLIDFPPTATMAIITATNLSFVASCAAWFVQFRKEMDRNVERLQLQAWQLRQVLPPEEEPPRPSTVPKSLPPPGESTGSVAATRIDTQSRMGALDATVDDGKTESRYEILETLQGDDVGDVLLCRDRRIGREVAMKVLRAEYAGDTVKVSRFLREACLQAKLEHPSIVPVYDLGMSRSGVPFVTMKRLRGTTLSRALDELRRDAEPADSPRFHKLLEAFISACLAVEYAHAAGVAHGGLGAERILLGDYGELYVTGWGASRDSLDAGVVADLRALGAVLFELLTLARFEAGGAADTRPSVRFPERDVAPELDTICTQAMSPEDDGYRAVRELREAIERFLDGERDVVRRRSMAVEHERAATKAFASAMAGGPGASEARAGAMREVTRSLALDPSNAQATALLMRLLTEPPREMPAEAREAVLAEGFANLREGAGIAAYLYAVWFLLFPLVYALGIRSLPLYGLVSLAFVAAIAAFARTSRDREMSGEVYLDVILSMIAASTLATIAGSFILVPCLVVANLAGFLFQIGPRRRVIVIALGCLAMLAPVVLEAAGVVPRSYVFRDGHIVILPHLLELTGRGAIGLLAFVHVVVVAGASFFFARFRSTLSRTEEAAQLNAWQLRQLVPLEVKGSE